MNTRIESRYRKDTLKKRILFLKELENQKSTVLQEIIQECEYEYLSLLRDLNYHPRTKKRYQYIEYPITSFEWLPELKTFVGESKDLYTGKHDYNLPNGRGQFHIVNPKTGNWRRFRWTKNGNDGMFFISEDQLICKIIYEQ